MEISGSHFSSRLVLITLVLTPRSFAISLYAGHAGSITIISSPGLRTEENVQKIANRPPTVAMMFSGHISGFILLLLKFVK